MHELPRSHVLAAASSARSSRGLSAAAVDCTCHWALDALDYGAVLLDRDGKLVYGNRQARLRLHEGQPVSLAPTGLRYRHAADRARVQSAIDAAALGGRRQMVCIVAGDDPLDIAVMPVAADVADADGGEAVLLLLSRARICEPLSVDFFARTRGLSAAETRVLEALCGSGGRPADLAASLNLEVTTVRTHLKHIRAKTGARSVDELVQQVARLPPMMNALA